MWFAVVATTALLYQPEHQPNEQGLGHIYIYRVCRTEYRIWFVCLFTIVQFDFRSLSFVCVERSRAPTFFSISSTFVALCTANNDNNSHRHNRIARSQRTTQQTQICQTEEKWKDSGGHAECASFAYERNARYIQLNLPFVSGKLFK